MDGTWFIDYLSGSTEVLYEPSSEEIILQMLDIAEVGPNDIVYDLGCGDGRIVIAAASIRGARGIGIDHDPERVRESRANARSAKVAEQVHFFEGDLFEWDFSDASVLMLYLLPEANLRLRPKILREMKPGSRIVSHSHGMGGWKADRTVTTPDYHIHSWVVPMNACGTWEWTLPDQYSGQQEHFRIQFDQIYQRLFGQFLIPPEDPVLVNPEICGDRINFSVARHQNGHRHMTRYSGMMAGDCIEGYAAIEAEKIRWIAKRHSPARVNRAIQ